MDSRDGALVTALVGDDVGIAETLSKLQRVTPDDERIQVELAQLELTKGNPDLALKLAQGNVLAAETGRVPVYLIDDVFGELDKARRNALMGTLPEGAQRLITTTNLDWMEDAESGLTVMRVDAGAVE